MKKIINELKDIIKEEYKFILLLIFITIVTLYPLDYYVTTGGGIKSIDSRIHMKNPYKQKGSFNLSYVSQLKGTVSTYLLSYIFPSWEREKMKDYKYSTEENYKDIEYRSKIELESSTQNAIYNAYTLANKKVERTSYQILILGNVEKYNNDFKVGDEILAIDGKTYSKLTDYIKVIDSHKVNDIIDIKVKRNNKVLSIKTKIHEEKGVNIIGIYLLELYKYKTDPKVTVKFSKNEEGPSGGLMTALSIYNKLTKKDITHSRTIAGTGEMGNDGRIGSVGGIKYKLIGANKKADIFLVPQGNYKEAKKIKKEKHLKIKLINVSTLEEAITKLNKIDNK